MLLNHLKNLSIGILSSCLVISCDQTKGKLETETETSDTPQQDVKLNFDNPTFKDRAEELFYIKKYLDENVPKMFLKKNPKIVAEMRTYYAANGRYFTSEYTAYMLTNGENLSGQIAFKANQENLSFKDVKNRLYDFIPKDRTFEKVKVSKELSKLLDGTPAEETPPSEPVDVSNDTL